MLSFSLFQWNIEYVSKENTELVHKEKQRSNKWKNGGSQTKKVKAKVIKKKSGNMKHSTLQS